MRVDFCLHFGMHLGNIFVHQTFWCTDQKSPLPGAVIFPRGHLSSDTSAVLSWKCALVFGEKILILWLMIKMIKYSGNRSLVWMALMLMFGEEISTLLFKKFRKSRNFEMWWKSDFFFIFKNMGSGVRGIDLDSLRLIKMRLCASVGGVDVIS